MMWRKHGTKKIDNHGAAQPLDLQEPWKQAFNDQATLDDVYYCFRLLLGRNPFRAEWPGHSLLAGGPLKDVVVSYLDSPEFKQRQLGRFDASQVVLCEVQGFKLYVPINDSQVGRGIVATRTYEPLVTNLLRQNLQRGDVVVDVGANIGYFSMLAASRVGSTGRVYAFEPFAQNVKLLHLSRQANRFEQIEIFPVAVGADRRLYLYDNAGTNGFISPLVDDFRTVMQSTIVFAACLDDVLKDAARVDFIKLDVEGAEDLVLRGAEALLRRHRPVIVSEFAPPAMQSVSGAAPTDYLQRLLVTPEYELSVLDERGTLPFRREIGHVLNYFETKHGSHIDVLATPRSLI